MRDYARTVGLPEPDRRPATTREAIDELVRAHELMGDPLAFRDLGIARGKVRKVIEMLREGSGDG